MEIKQDNVDKLVRECWTSVQRKIESGHPLSSEKTLVFLFATEVVKRCKDNKLKIDFEYYAYKKIKGSSRYLDLLFYTDDKFKVALEFKFPKKSSRNNSNRTQNRRAVYRDLARLKFLKGTNSPDKNIKACYFIMAVNEDEYLNNKNLKKFENFLTKHGHKLDVSKKYKIDGIELCGANYEFEWENIISLQDNQCRIDGIFAYLKEIRV